MLAGIGYARPFLYSVGHIPFSQPKVPVAGSLGFLYISTTLGADSKRLVRPVAKTILPFLQVFGVVTVASVAYLRDHGHCLDAAHGFSVTNRLPQELSRLLRSRNGASRLTYRAFQAEMV
jgi:hypothetical protein